MEVSLTTAKYINILYLNTLPNTFDIVGTEYNSNYTYDWTGHIVPVTRIRYCVPGTVAIPHGIRRYIVNISGGN